MTSATVINFPGGRVEVTSSRRNRTVDIVAIGPREALGEYAAQLLSDYPSLGYGTWVDAPKPVGTGEGSWRLTASRSASCD